jgi:uncharacterized protein YndB with AHSA1/START domain
MEKDLYCEKSILIQATADAIWDVLTNPEKIPIYLFGSQVNTDWKPGSPITFSRNPDGIPYVDKGKIIEYMNGKVLKFSYWSSQEGYEDIPENYSVVTYTIQKEAGKGFELTYRREKIPLEFERANQEKYLPMLMKGIKNLAEQGAKNLQNEQNNF